MDDTEIFWIFFYTKPFQYGKIRNAQFREGGKGDIALIKGGNSRFLSCCIFWTTICNSARDNFLELKLFSSTRSTTSVRTVFQNSVPSKRYNSTKTRNFILNEGNIFPTPQFEHNIFFERHCFRIPKRLIWNIFEKLWCHLKTFTSKLSQVWKRSRGIDFPSEIWPKFLMFGMIIFGSTEGIIYHIIRFREHYCKISKT